jgi:hypothetical protein
MACRESVLGNVEGPSRMWGSDSQQHQGCWFGRESERVIVPEKSWKQDGGKDPHFWHASEGDEER